VEVLSKVLKSKCTVVFFQYFVLIDIFFLSYLVCYLFHVLELVRNVTHSLVKQNRPRG